MLDADGLKERFHVKNPHTQVGHSGFSFSWLKMYVLLVHARKIRGGGLFAGTRDNIASLF